VQAIALRHKMKMATDYVAFFFEKMVGARQQSWTSRLQSRFSADSNVRFIIRGAVDEQKVIQGS
jgi:hypothetical protein